jgi:dihydroorotate dehydrogenase
VVATIQEGWTIDDTANDYARCARWAAESGADCIETNFSCPNVNTADGQLYQVSSDAAVVAQRVREAIGETPYVIKIGHMPEADRARELLGAVAAHVDGLAMTNSVATTVRMPDGEMLFDGQRRGICGQATLEASLEQIRLFAGLVDEQGLDLSLVGVGGASTAADVAAYLAAGAETVHIATAAMVNPLTAQQIRRQWARN